jgi:hypothetical protein
MAAVAGAAKYDVRALLAFRSRFDAAKQSGQDQMVSIGPSIKSLQRCRILRKE